MSDQEFERCGASRNQRFVTIENDGSAYYSGSMATDASAQSSSKTILRTLLAYVSQDWLTFLPDLLTLLRRWLKRQTHDGMYDILDYDATLELVDPKGKTAIFKRRQRVKFLQDHIIAFQDYAWGEGDIFEDYQVSPGQIVDRYQEGDQWNILISLRQTKSAGEIIDVFTERTIKRGFTKAKEWWQVEVRHHTRHFKLAIIFPHQRPCRQAMLRHRHRQTTFEPKHFTALPDGRQVLTWETNSLKRFETYNLTWRW